VARRSRATLKLGFYWDFILWQAPKTGTSLIRKTLSPIKAVLCGIRFFPIPELLTKSTLKPNMLRNGL
jgi:hypothetical protein